MQLETSLTLAGLINHTINITYIIIIHVYCTCTFAITCTCTRTVCNVHVHVHVHVICVHCTLYYRQTGEVEDTCTCISYSVISSLINDDIKMK